MLIITKQWHYPQTSDFRENNRFLSTTMAFTSGAASEEFKLLTEYASNFQ